MSRKIYTDPESALKSCKPFVKDKLKIKMTDTPVNRHEKTCERYVRTLRERIRIKLNSQSYKVPLSLYEYALEASIIELNNMVNSLTDNVSPSNIISGKTIDYNHDIKVPWGTIIDVKIPDDKDTNNSRVESCIALGYTDSTYGGLIVASIANDLKPTTIRHKMFTKNQNNELLIREMNRI